MSFRARLTSFFVLIVVVPMMAVGVLGFRLIGDSAQGKADARVNGLASAAASLYVSSSAAARADAQTVARELAAAQGATLMSQLSTLATQTGLARLMVTQGNRTLADVGGRAAIAPGVALIKAPGVAADTRVTVSTLAASQYVSQLTSVRGVQVVVREGRRVLASSLRAPGRSSLPRQGEVSLAGRSYRVLTQSFPGFGRARVQVTVLSAGSATATSVSASRLVAGVIIAGFLLLAFGFSVLASRALQGQIRRFLQAARRLGSGDFSAQVPTDGHDDFAALGEEFNRMSEELERKLDELSQERARLRDSISRIGQTFAANLDRDALLEVALSTGIDAVGGDCGRISVRAGPSQPLREAARTGSLKNLEQSMLAAERSALSGGDARDEQGAGEVSAISFSLGHLDPAGQIRGLMTLARRGGPFSAEDCDLLESLASQTALALENIELHIQVSRQAVTDELTGLSNHGHFQDLLVGEIERVLRYHDPVGLIMLDIDNFKSVNDTYGHQQGDLVLKHVARVLRDNSREADSPARYGGEEMALILPHTDLEGSHAIAERVRGAIEALRVPRVDGQPPLRITASVGVAATTEGTKDELIAAADAAMYTAKREGKNRTVRALPEAAAVAPAE